MSAHTVAVDWSGDAHQAHKRIWLAECVDPGRLLRLEAGRDRTALADHLLQMGDTTVIGLDFAFSFPAWFFEAFGLTSAPDLWAHVAEHGERWLADCEPPFWGRRGRPRPALDHLPWRRCELAAPAIGGIRPKSIFQIGGAGAVGTGSIRGIPLLSRLAGRGATIWPFVNGGSPIVLEIYPRLLTGAVRKSDAEHRAAYLASFYPHLDADHVRLASAHADAFDAAVSALVMHNCWADLSALPVETDPGLKLEGRIWHPHWRSDQP